MNNAVFIALFSVFCGVFTIFISVYAAKKKGKNTDKPKDGDQA